jgi:hypothetical protein
MTRRDLSDAAVVAGLFALGVVIDVVLTVIGLEVLEAVGLWPLDIDADR